MDAVVDDFQDGTMVNGGGASEPAVAAGLQVSKVWGGLIQDYAAGRQEALAELYDAAVSVLYGFALWRTQSPEDAADVVQDVFIRLAERRSRLTEVRDARAWLLTVTHRAAIDLVRRRTRRRARPLEQCHFLTAEGGDPDRAVDAARVSALLTALPDKQRDVIFLHHFAGCTFAAIGEIVGAPTFTAASRYRLGIAKLRRLLGGTT